MTEKNQTWDIVCYSKSAEDNAEFLEDAIRHKFAPAVTGCLQFRHTLTPGKNGGRGGVPSVFHKNWPKKSM